MVLSGSSEAVDPSNDALCTLLFGLLSHPERQLALIKPKVGVQECPSHVTVKLAALLPE